MFNYGVTTDETIFNNPCRDHGLRWLYVYSSSIFYRFVGVYYLGNGDIGAAVIESSPGVNCPRYSSGRYAGRREKFPD